MIFGDEATGVVAFLVIFVAVVGGGTGDSDFLDDFAALMVDGNSGLLVNVLVDVVVAVGFGFIVGVRDVVTSTVGSVIIDVLCGMVVDGFMFTVFIMVFSARDRLLNVLTLGISVLTCAKFSGKKGAIQSIGA